MGTWGVGPFDHDGGATMVLRMMKPIERAVSIKSNRAAGRYYQDARSSIQVLLLSHGTDILGGPALLHALKAMQRMVADKEWLNEWEDPFEIQKQVVLELNKVKRTIAKCEQCQTEMRTQTLGIFRSSRPAKRRRARNKRTKRTRKTRA